MSSFGIKGQRSRVKGQCIKYLRSDVKVRVFKGQKSMVKGQSQRSKCMVSKTKANARGLGLRVRVARVVKDLVSRFEVRV